MLSTATSSPRNTCALGLPRPAVRPSPRPSGCDRMAPFAQSTGLHLQNWTTSRSDMMSPVISARRASQSYLPGKTPAGNGKTK